MKKPWRPQTKWEGIGEIIAMILVTVAIIAACVGAAYFIESVRASIWANAIRNVGCTCPPPGDL